MICIRRVCLCFVLLALLQAPAKAQDVQIGVLGIFHPHELIVAAIPGEAIVVSISGQESEIVLFSDSPGSVIRLSLSGNAILVEHGGHSFFSRELHVTARDHGAARFRLSVPGKISRRYRGLLRVAPSKFELQPIVTMDLETAVASAVEAESDPDAPFEAFKAQAVVARTFFTAGAGRHHNFDFCDLTHCQLLREPPAATSPAALAAASTRGLILAYDGKPFTAMFSRSCGGRTRTPAELGMSPGVYPYFSVVCEYCRRSPFRWQQRLSHEDAERLAAKTEAARLALNRRLGWSTIQSNSYSMHREGNDVVLQGVGQGHGIGLCQRGARSMAGAGAGFRDLLLHYFPNATIATRELAALR